MARNTSVDIGDELSEFVAGGVKKGRYGSASEMVRAGLRLLQDQETKMAALRAAVQEGIDSGSAVPFDFGEFRAARKNYDPVDSSSLSVEEVPPSLGDDGPAIIRNTSSAI